MNITRTASTTTNKKVLRKRSVMNCVGPILVTLGFIFNLYTVLIYFVFPNTDLIKWEFKVRDKKEGIWVHYSLFLIYLVLLLLTIWSFLAAACTDPGYLPNEKRTYDKTSLGKRECFLWNYLDKLEGGPEVAAAILRLQRLKSVEEIAKPPDEKDAPIVRLTQSGDEEAGSS